MLTVTYADSVPRVAGSLPIFRAPLIRNGLRGMRPHSKLSGRKDENRSHRNLPARGWPEHPLLLMGGFSAGLPCINAVDW